MKEGMLPRVLNGVGAIFCFASAVLGGMLEFPSCFLPGATFPLGVGIFLLLEMLYPRPLSTAIPKVGLPWVFEAIHEGKMSGLVIGVIFTLASGIPALVLLFMLHEMQAGLSMAFLSMSMAISCIAGTLIDRWEIRQVLGRL